MAKLHNRSHKKFWKSSTIFSKFQISQFIKPFITWEKGSRMYNEESDEDEQLLKKEHKGMIYHGWRPIWFWPGLTGNSPGYPGPWKKSDLNFKFRDGSMKVATARYQNFHKNRRFIRGQDFRFWPLEDDSEITTFQTCKTNTYSMRLLCLPDCGSAIFWKLETNFTVVFSIK